jgi:replicative DNA helicase
MAITTSNTVAYAELVRDAAIKRALLDAMTRAGKKAYSNKFAALESLDGLLEEARQLRARVAPAGQAGPDDKPLSLVPEPLVST